MIFLVSEALKILCFWEIYRGMFCLCVMFNVGIGSGILFFFIIVSCP